MMTGIFLSQVRALAINIWREAIRDRLLHILVGSGAVLMVFSQILGEMAVGGRERVIQNMGFWVLGMWGLLAIMYMGSNILKREIQRKTVYMVLSRPVTRPTFLIGKYVGMLIVLFNMFVLLTFVWLVMLQFNAIPFSSQHAWALTFIFGEWVLLAAISLFFSSFTSPILHNFFLVGISFLGHWSSDLRILADQIKNPVWIKHVLQSIYYVLPNLEALNFRGEALYNSYIDPGLIGQGALVWLCWTGTILVAANLIFLQRKLL